MSEAENRLRDSLEDITDEEEEEDGEVEEGEIQMEVGGYDEDELLLGSEDEDVDLSPPLPPPQLSPPPPPPPPPPPQNNDPEGVEFVEKVVMEDYVDGPHCPHEDGLQLHGPQGQLNKMDMDHEEDGHESEISDSERHDGSGEGGEMVEDSILEQENGEYKSDEGEEDGTYPGSSLSSSDVSSDELDTLLDEDLPENFRRAPLPNPKRRKLVHDKLNSGSEKAILENGDTTGDIENGDNTGDLENGDTMGDVNDGDGDPNREYIVKQLIMLDEKGKNAQEVLPAGWLEVKHASGMPLYLHRKTRVCTLARPYFLGPASARRHSIPVSAVPCLAYQRALKKEEENVLEFKELQNNNTNISEDNETPSAPAARHQRSTEIESSTKPNCPFSKDEVILAQLVNTASKAADDMGKMLDPTVDTATPSETTPPLLPPAKVEPINANATNSVEPTELRKYCEKLFKFKIVTSKRFNSWSARRKHTKDLKRKQLERPSLPKGVKLITFPVLGANGKPEGGREYVLNPVGKSAVCILHEYVQHALRKQPNYIFKELENPNTPYSATVVINGMHYGTGYGSSKKQAKADAARVALEILIPDLKEFFNDSTGANASEFEHLQFFDQLDIDDSRITKICSDSSEPSPYTLLLSCLQRNFGILSSGVKFEMMSGAGSANKFRMSSGEFSVEISAANKKEAKQLASQALLKKIHPSIRKFGSILRLYGNSSVKTVKEKKQAEQQVTTLQSKAVANSPNYAILEKLRQEMGKLAQAKAKANDVVPNSGSAVGDSNKGLP